MPSRTSVSTRLPLPTGTVDLFTTTRKRELSSAAPTLRAAASRYARLASPDFSGGVPTAMKMTSLSAAGAVSDVRKSIPPRCGRQPE
jgi:hypothetical protein